MVPRGKLCYLLCVLGAAVLLLLLISPHRSASFAPGASPPTDAAGLASPVPHLGEPQRVVHDDEAVVSTPQDDLKQVRPIDTLAERNGTSEYLLLLAWRPILLTAQVLHLRSIGWRGHIVFVCPDDEDAVVATRLFVHNSSAYGSTEVFLHPVRTRVALTNGRYFLLAAHRFLSLLKSRLSDYQSDRERVLVVAVDTSRTLWCHDLFAAIRRGDRAITLAGSPLKPGSYLWKRAAQADIYMHLPKFALDKPSKVSERAAGARRRYLVFSHIVGGELKALCSLLDAIAQRIAGLPPGLAFEPAMADAAIPFFERGVAVLNFWAPDRTSKCIGYGTQGQAEGACHPQGGNIQATLPPSMRRQRDVVVLNYWACGPLLPPRGVAAEGYVVPPEGIAPENCRRLYSSKKRVFAVSSPLSTITRAPLIDQLLKRKPLVVSTWRNHVYPSRGRSTSVGSCDGRRVDAILSVAVGYTHDKLHLFVRTFLNTHRQGTSKLVLFLRGDHIEGFRTAYPSDDIILVDAAPFFNKSPTAYCHIVLSRMDMMRAFLAAHNVTALQCLRNILVVDTRDSVFQLDPFEALERLIAQQRSHGNWHTTSSEDFFLIPMERLFLGESDFFNNSPYRLNRLWVLKTFGATFFHMLMQEPVTGNASTSNGVTFPILCGGLYMGTATAIMDFLDVFVASAVALGGCSVNDQGLLIGLVAAGLGESRYPHPVFLADPYTTPFTNGPRGGGEMIWDAQGRVVDCNGAPYAVLHQYTHFNDFVAHFSRKALPL